ncbi:MAG: universal stress protein [Nitrososphaerota archaeon]
MADEILVAVDGSPHSYRVVETAVELAKRSGAKILLAHVVQKLDTPEEFAQFVKAERVDADPDLYYRRLVGETILEKLGAKVYSARLEMEKILEFGDPSDKILEIADARNPSLIVLGIVGLRGLRRVAALGSVARRVIENAKVPVVVVP